MLYSLLMSALLMGLAGLPHCSAMCAAPCALVAPQGVSWRVLLGRSLGYASLGAVAAGAAATLSSWARWSTALQPLWVMVLAAAVLLGASMVLTGRMPAAVQQAGQAGYESVHRFMITSPLLARVPLLRALLPVIFGAGWAALPCGLIYAAVTVATLAPSVPEGALVMLVFSLPGAVALWWLPRRFGAVAATAPGQGRSALGASVGVAPVFWLKAVSASPGPGEPLAHDEPEPDLIAPAALQTGWRQRLSDPRWALRLSGAMLCAAAGWALVHRLTAQWQAWCA